MAGVLELFRFLLEDDFREQFYQEVFTLVARNVQNAERPTALADLLRAIPEEDEDDSDAATTVADTTSTEAEVCDI